MDQLSQHEVAKLLNVSIDTLKTYRSLKREHSTLALIPTGEIVNRSRHYTQEDLVEWLVRNPDRLALMQFADAERKAMLPLALGIPAAPAEPVVGLGLLNPHLHQEEAQ